MKHSTYREWVLLSATGDLDASEQSLLDKHIESCDSCAEEFRRLGAMRGILDKSKPGVDVSDALLLEARQELRGALRTERARPAFSWSGIRFAPLGLRYGLGAAFLLACGFLGGRLLLLPGHGGGPAPANTALIQPIEGETRISNVRFIDTGRVSGDVDFTFDAVTPMHMKGGVDDPAIQKVLTHALLNEQNPGVRLRAVSAISAPGGDHQDNAVKTALIRVLRWDGNAGVRREALNALRHLPWDEDIKEAFLRTLMSDKNPGLRIAAMNGLDSAQTLSRQPDREFMDVLRQKAQTDQNNYIRIKARAAIQETEHE